MPRAYAYLEEQQRDWEEYQADLKFFENHWYPILFFVVFL